MDATTTHSMSWLIQQLSAAHPEFSFEEAERFSWSPSTNTIFYSTAQSDTGGLLLHELSHALLGHRSYERDVQLLAMETAAWERAKAYVAEHSELAELADSSDSATKVLIDLSEDAIQDHLDTYRDWLHARSTCPKCSANGYQTDTHAYACPACTHTWRVNEARVCALRRYSGT